MNDWVGCLRGYPGVRTPHIDALARRGVLFANTHCASPLCNPSRTALFTGLRTSTTGIYNNDQFWRPALPGVVTMPQYFRRNGYHVAGAGKIFHHTSGFNPPDQWDEFKLQVFDDPWWRRPEWFPWNVKTPPPPGHPFNGLDNFQGEFDWGMPPKKEAEYGDRKRSGLAGAAEAHLAGRGPRDGVAVDVRDGDNGVVEGGADMHSAPFNILTLTATLGRRSFFLNFSHFAVSLPYFLLFAMVFLGPFLVRAFVLER